MNKTLPFIMLLLILSGMVETNPGPVNGIFEGTEEREIFNRLRTKERKCSKMVSHKQYLEECVMSNTVPSGVSIKMQLSEAFYHEKMDITNWVKESESMLLGRLIHYYTDNIRLIKLDIEQEYSVLASISDISRLESLKADIKAINKKLVKECKKTKTIKMQKLNKSGHAIDRPLWQPQLSLGIKEKPILESNAWLNDNIIDAACKLLKMQYPYIQGMATVVLSLAGFDYNPFESMQIHCVNQNHWVLTTSLGGRVKIFDSMKPDVASPDLVKQMNELYSPDGNDISYEFANCQQQHGITDCGLFALAFLTDLCNGHNIVKNEESFEKLLRKGYNGTIPEEKGGIYIWYQ